MSEAVQRAESQLRCLVARWLYLYKHPWKQADAEQSWDSGQAHRHAWLEMADGLIAELGLRLDAAARFIEDDGKAIHTRWVTHWKADDEPA
jgi:hypothetical protein